MYAVVEQKTDLVHMLEHIHIQAHYSNAPAEHK